MMLYLRMIHQAFQPVASFVNKMILIAGVVLAITGFFLHYHLQDLPHVKAEKQTSEMRKVIYTVLDDKRFDSNYALSIQRDVFRSGVCFTVGEGCTNNPSDGDTRYNSSLVGGIGNYMAVPYANPPASGLAWMHDSLQNVGFVPHTYAAGIGFYSISAFGTVWKLFRNITFFVMAIAIVVVGFLIMFRVKIDSQTVINLENSLPRIVITLLLITFSFAIAGFLVDLMYVLLLMVTSIFGSVKDTGIPSLEAANLQSIYLTNQIPLFDWFFSGAYVGIYTEGVRGLIEIIPTAVKGVVYPILMIFVGITAHNLLARFFSAWNVEGGISFGASLNVPFVRILLELAIYALLLVVVPMIVYQLIPWIIGITIVLTLFFRIFFMLINAYVQIVINIIFAPVLILPNVLPGNNSFVDWLKRLVGNLLTFPITAILLITIQLIGLNDEFIGGRTIAGDPITANAALTQFSMPMLALKTSQLVPIIAAVFMLLIPDLVKKVTDAISGPALIEAGPSTLFASAGGAAGAVVGQYAGLASFAKTMQGTAVGKALGVVPGLGQLTKSESREPISKGSPDLVELAKEQAEANKVGG